MAPMLTSISTHRKAQLDYFRVHKSLMANSKFAGEPLVKAATEQGTDAEKEAAAIGGGNCSIVRRSPLEPEKFAKCTRFEFTARDSEKKEASQDPNADSEDDMAESVVQKKVKRKLLFPRKNESCRPFKRTHRDISDCFIDKAFEERDE